MKKKLLAVAAIASPMLVVPALVVALALPLAARAADAARQGDPRANAERMEKRMRLARTLGLAEALDLDANQALRLRDTIAKFDDRRLQAHVQLRDARQVLRRAAQGEKVAPAEVDTAIQKALDARAQIQAVDRDLVATVTKDLSPEKKARAVLFLARFESRFGRHRMGMMHGPGEPGMGPGGMGPGGMRGRGGPGGGMGMGPGGPGEMMGMAPPGGSDEWDDEE